MDFQTTILFPTQEMCTPCASGTVQPSEGKDHCSERCQAGTKSSVNGTVCIPCLPTETSPDESGSCTICPQTMYTTDRRTLRPCEEGFSCSAGIRQPCKDGEFAPSRSQTCTMCPAGNHGEPSHATCVLCSPGTFSISVGAEQAADCALCPPGTFSTANRTECDQCPSGKWSNQTAATSDGDCTACPLGKFSNIKGLASIKDCSDCTPGTVGMAVFEGATDKSTGCDECGIGTFVAEAGQIECMECEAGRTTETAGSTYCTACLPGRYLDMSLENPVCTDCSAGFYTNSSGATECEQCQCFSYGGILQSAHPFVRFTLLRDNQ